MNNNGEKVCMLAGTVHACFAYNVHDAIMNTQLSIFAQGSDVAIYYSGPDRLS